MAGDGVKVGTGYIQIMPETKDFTAALRSDSSISSSGESAGGKFSGGFRKGLSIASAAAAAATTVVAAFGGASVKVGAQFDASMSQVAATMGTTVDQITDLRDFAQEMGRTTAFSATEAAEALNYMALAGYDAETSMNMLPTVLDLAAAGGIDLASASDMVTDAQSALGLELNETTELVDKMAATSSKSNTSVAQLGEAILKICGTANIMSGGTTELATALGLLADNGIKGAEGGTHLRNILLSLASPTTDAANLLDSLGVSAVDSEGNMRPLQDIMLELNDSLDGMGEADKAAIISKIFNKTDIASVNALLGTSKDRWEELSGAIEDADGAAKAMAETQLDNLAGDITLFKSALEGAQITLSDVLTPSLREFVQFGTDAVSGLTAAFQEGGLEGAMSALGDYISQGAEMLMESLPTLMDAGMALIESLLDGLVENTPMIAETAVELVVSFVDHISTMLPTLISAFLEIVTQITHAIIANLPQILSALWQGITGSLTAFGCNLEGTGILLGALLVKGISSKGLSGIQDMIGKMGSMFSQGLSTGGIIGVAIAGTAALAVAISTIYESMHTAYQEASPFTEALAGIAAANTELSQAITTTKEAYETSVAASEASAGAAETLYGKLQDLIAGYDGTAGSAPMIQGVVSELNELVPGLGLAWDEVTNSLNLTNEEIYANIEAMRAQAQVAALQNLYTESLKEQYTAQKNLSDASKAAGEVLASYGLTVQDVIDLTQGGIGAEIEWGQKLMESGVALTDVTFATEEVMNAMNGYFEASHNAEDAAGNVTFAETELQSAMEAAAAAVVNNKDTVIESANEINENVSFEPAIEEAVTAGEEVPSEFASSIEAGTPDVEVAAADMAQAVVDEVADTPTEMYSTGSDAGSQMDTGLQEQLDPIKQTIQTMASYFGTETAQIGMGMYNLAITAITGFAAAITNTTASQVVPAIQSMVSGIATSMSSLPNQMYSVGDQAGSGLYSGLSAWSGALSSLAWGIANSINAAARAALQIHSPSKVMEEIGLYTAEGLSIGIEKGTDEVIDSTDDLILGIAGTTAGYDYETAGAADQGRDNINGYMLQVLDLLDKISKMQFVLDSGEVIGALDNKFAQMRTRQERG